MTPVQARFFQVHGYLRLDGFYPKARMRPLSQHLRAELKRKKLWPAGKGSARSLQDLPVFQQNARVSKALELSSFQSTLLSPELLLASRELAGVPLAASGFQALVSLPQQGPWSLGALNWHVDVKADPHDRLPGIQAFVLIEDVVPRGGGTLALAGSHRPTSTASAANLRQVLKSTDGLESKLRELGIEIVEMAGRAGDVILMDLRTLHSPSVNATPELRMMATARFFAR